MMVLLEGCNTSLQTAPKIIHYYDLLKSYIVWKQLLNTAWYCSVTFPVSRLMIWGHAATYLLRSR